MAKVILKFLKIMGIGLLSFIGFIILAFITLNWIYPAVLRASHRIKTPGIDLMETVEIGGIEQVLYFRGENTKNPVLLFIHGGPGYPEMAFLHDFQYAWEKDFTVVQWDQRNSGKTYFLNDPETVLESMSFEHSLSDAYEVTQYIKQKLDKDKIVILGFSWGSVLGTALVQTYPQDYSAYIGLGQAINMRENERVGYEELLKTVLASGNKKDINAIEALNPYPPPQTFDETFIQQMSAVRRYQAKYKLANEPMWRIISTLLTSPYYSLKEKNYYNMDFLNYHYPTFSYLFDEYDIHNFGVTYEIPVYYIMGELDYQTPYPLAKDFFKEITAPSKAFFTIANAGHGAMRDNKTEFNRILLEEIRPLIQD